MEGVKKLNKKKTNTEVDKEPKAPLVEEIVIVDPIIVSAEEKFTLIPQVKRLEINGIIYPKEKILTDKALMTALIVGNSPFIKKV